METANKLQFAAADLFLDLQEEALRNPHHVSSEVLKLARRVYKAALKQAEELEAAALKN